VIIAEKIGDRLQYSLVQLKAAHRSQDGQAIPFGIEQESDGTKRILDLIPALHSFKQKPLCYFIDEIDRSLHPMLAREFIDFFFRSCQNRPAQLIVTTHESSLLDQDLLRRDEIWFAEKDEQGATKLYSLLDFAPRNDLDLRKNYLQGRFGAIPFLGGMERLLEKQQHPAGAKIE
jgi:AAA15 family ATPase/GTPase